MIILLLTAQAKDYIKRAKVWRNRVWNVDKRGKPSSYLISLLVLRAYENAKRYGGGDRELVAHSL